MQMQIKNDGCGDGGRIGFSRYPEAVNVASIIVEPESAFQRRVFERESVVEFEIVGKGQSRYGRTS
jgi:hypothetical protein